MRGWYKCLQTLTLARSRKAVWAVATLACLSFQAASTEPCRARPKLNVSAHCRGPATVLIAFRFTDASSSDWPPDRNTTPATVECWVRLELAPLPHQLLPGTAGGTVRWGAVTVARAISGVDALRGQSWPAVTMFGLSSVPSSSTWWSASALYV